MVDCLIRLLSRRMLVSISTHGIKHSNITPGEKDG
jgi:hypothetical protein